MAEIRLNQIREFQINNINDISQFILFLIKGEIYPPNQLEDNVLSLHTENLQLGISNFLNNVTSFYSLVIEKLKESVFLTQRIYGIFLKFPLRYANGVNKDMFFHVIIYLVKLSFRLQDYIYRSEFDNETLSEIIINLLLNTIKLNPIKNE